MGVPSGLRRHPVAFSLGGGLLLLLAAAVAVGWYTLGEERRAGRLLSRLLSHRLGVAVRVERALAAPSRFTLKGITVPPGEHWGGVLEIRELRVDGGVLPMVFPRGRTLAVVAEATAVTLAKAPAPLAPPAPDTLSAARQAILGLLGWPAAVSLEIKGGEVRTAAGVLGFDLTGAKSEDGALTVRIDWHRAGEPPAMRLEARGAAAGDAVRVSLRLDGEPSRLPALWPTTLPAPAHLAAEADLTLSEAPELHVAGRLRATPAGGEPPVPVAARFEGRYRPGLQRVDLVRLTLDRDPDVRLELAGSAEELGRAPRLSLKAGGALDGARLSGDAAYSQASGALTAHLALQPFVPNRLLARLGYAPLPVEVTARRAALTLRGEIPGGGPLRLEGAVRVDELRVPDWTTGAPLGGVLRFAGSLSREGRPIVRAELARAELSLRSPQGTLATMTARSQPRRGGEAGGPGPVAVEGRVQDLSRLPRPDWLAVRLAGEARAGGILEWGDSGPRFAGELGLHVTRAEMAAESPIVISGLRASLPLAWGGGGEPPPGAVTAESLAAFGFVLRRLASPARLSGRTLSLPEISYVHYGGSGKGYLNADLGGSPVPLRVRLEGEGVDLATLTTEYGLTVGRITGRVRYLLVAQYSRAQGLLAAGQVASEPPGGEVNIDALKKLLSYAEGDPTGILRQTLESLSVFSYESLTGDVRLGPPGGRVSLSLTGKKRLGLFPGPVRAINFQNVPLSLLTRTFGQPRRDPQ